MKWIAIIPSHNPLPTLVLALLAGAASPILASGIYTQDFEAPVGAEWSDTTQSTTPIGGRGFLGPFDNHAVSLSLSGLPAHSSVTIEFDLFILSSWDGNGDSCCGPDVFNLSVSGGPADLINTTFSNHGPGFENRQAYPDSFPGGSHPDTTGAVELDTLGFPLIGSASHTDAVYHLSATFAHSASGVEFVFSGLGLQGMPDEGWGLDNVTVRLDTSVPDGGMTMATLLIGLAVLGGGRRLARR